MFVCLFVWMDGGGQCRTTLKYFSISYQGPRFWNSLGRLTELNNLTKFKATLKADLLAKYSSD